MLDYTELLESSTRYWDNQPTTTPGTLNSFAGTFNFSDHQVIPSPLLNLISERWPEAVRLTRIELDDINDFLNSIWEGPGSMSKVVRLTHELRNTRKAGKTVDLNSLFKGYVTPTVDSDLTVEED